MKQIYLIITKAILSSKNYLLNSLKTCNFLTFIPAKFQLINQFSFSSVHATFKTSLNKKYCSNDTFFRRMLPLLIIKILCYITATRQSHRTLPNQLFPFSCRISYTKYLYKYFTQRRPFWKINTIFMRLMFYNNPELISKTTK